jgi:hypothetical protein
MSLTEQRRQQLDSIVQDMVKNKESDNTIQFVVDDFKTKYANEQLKPLQVEAPKKESLLTKASNISEKTLGKVSDLLFGSTGKAVGSLFTSGLASGAELIGKETVFGADTKKLQQQAEENITPANIAFTTLELYPGGGFVSKYLKNIPGGAKLAEGFSKVVAKLPEALKSKAVKQYSEALGATTKENKFLTKKVVPELLEKGVTAKNLEGLASKATTGVETSGELIGSFIDNLPDTAKMKVKPVIEALQSSKAEYIVDGVNLEPGITKTADELSKTIAQFGNEISTKSLRAVGQVWDKIIAKGGGFAGKTLKEGGELDLKKMATNAIRDELAKEYPDLAKLKAEYTLWKNVEKITTETLQRKSTQGRGLSQIITTVAGGATGASQGEGITERVKNAAIGALIGKYASTFNAPGYKMLSANTKNKLADIIASGDIKKIGIALSKISAAIKNIAD